MIRASISIGARLWQIPSPVKYGTYSSEGQHAAGKIVRVWFITLCKTLCAMYDVLGWVFRSKEGEYAVDEVRVPFLLSRNAVIARGPIMLKPLLNFNAPKQSPESMHEVHQPQRFVSFTTCFRGLLLWAVRELLRAIEISPKPQNHVSPRNDGFIGKALLLSYFLFHLSFFAQAQYTGGPGDGHAMGELQLRPLAVNELSTAEGYSIYPSLAKSGENIYLTSPAPGEFTLVDLAGRTIHTQTFEAPAQQLPIPVTYTGLYIGILRTVEGTFTQKIAVVE